MALIKANEDKMTLNGARFEVVKVRLSKGENRRPEFVSINPNKYVPAIQVITPGEDEPFNLYESHAIMKFICVHKELEDHWYPNSENKDIRLLAKMDEYLDWHHQYIRRGAGHWFFQTHF